MEKCPNCNKSLRGIFAVNLIPQSKTELINKNLGLKSIAYCTSCSNEFLSKIINEFNSQKREIESKLKEIINYIPVISSQAPLKWEYEIIEMVTAQTTSGTGFATELSRTFNDFFGTTSNTTNLKIANATQLCKTELKIKCAKLGGNAIISTDIDFNEIGSGSTNMLMVCMAGTAIKIKDLSSSDLKNINYIVEAIELTEKLEIINQQKI